MNQLLDKKDPGTFTRRFLTHFLRGYLRETTLDPVWRNEFERVDTAPLKGKERDVVVLGYSASSRNPDRAGTDS